MRHLPCVRGPHGRDAALVRALTAAVLAAVLATALAGCGGGDSGEASSPSPAPSAPRYSETDRETIAFMRTQYRVIQEALRACDTFVNDSAAAFDADDLAAYEAALKPWNAAYESLDQATQTFLTRPEGEDPRVREAMTLWRGFAGEVGRFYGVILAAVETYLEYGGESLEFDRVWTRLEEQRDLAYAAGLACDDVASSIWDPR